MPRQEEIARMLAGATVTEEARAAAAGDSSAAGANRAASLTIQQDVLAGHARVRSSLGGLQQAGGGGSRLLGHRRAGEHPGDLFLRLLQAAEA
jgi:hypothetical protein